MTGSVRPPTQGRPPANSKKVEAPNDDEGELDKLARVKKVREVETVKLSKISTCF
jgi:hypothetical protein